MESPKNYKSFKIDTMLIEYKKIGNNKFMIFLQYNNLKSQTNFIIDLENIHPAIKRTFTPRQYNILIKRLEKENKRGEE